MLAEGRKYQLKKMKFSFNILYKSIVESIDWGSKTPELNV